MENQEVCRLCRGCENLVSMFDSRFEHRKTEALRLSIRLATGLDIREDDIVSKMVCHRCCEIAVKLHKYRANAVANDKILKEQCGQTYIPLVVDQDELRRLSSQMLISRCKAMVLSSDRQSSFSIPKPAVNNEALESLNMSIKPEPAESKLEPYKHPSVKELCKKYPGIILPECVYKCDIRPVVTLDESEVEEWAEEEFKRVQQKLSWTKISIQKVGETSTIKHKNNEVDVAIPRVYQMKRPGPKSKTLNIIETNNTQSQLLLTDLEKPISYRPGPKCRKSELVIHSATKVVAQETKSIVNSIVSNKQPQIPETKLLSSNVQKPIVASSSKPESPISLLGENCNVSLLKDSDDSDVDFDPEDMVLTESDSDDSSTSKEELQYINNSFMKKRGSLRIKKLTTLDHNEDFDDDCRTPKDLSTSMTNRNLKNKQRSLRSNKYVLSSSSNQFVETDKRLHTDDINDIEPRVCKPRNSKVEALLKLDEKLMKFNEPISRNLIMNVSKSKNQNERSQKAEADTENLESTSNVESNDLYKENRKSLINKKKEVRKSTDKVKKPLQNTTDHLVNKHSKELTMDSEKSSSFIKDIQEPSHANQAHKKRPESEIAGDDLPNLIESRAQKVFLCHFCCKLCDTRKQLHEHQKSHLICKYCNCRMKNIEVLNKHEEICHKNVIQLNTLPTLKLTKVDKIQSIITKYPDAFDGGENVNSSNSLIQQISNSSISGAEFTQPIHISEDLTTFDSLSIKTEVWCISDESEDDVEYVGLSKKSLVEQSFLDLSLNGLSEKDMIQSLFVKHLKSGVGKCQKSSQTFIPRATDIKYTNSNLIVLENLFNQLFTYKIPVHLEIKPKISARFTRKIVSPQKGNLECWAHIKTVTVCKPSYKPIKSPATPVRIAPAKTPKASLEKNIFSKLSSSPPPLFNIVQSKKAPYLSSLLQTSKSVVVPSTPSIQTNTLILNNLLNTSPAVPTTSQLMPNTNILLTTNNQCMPSINGQKNNSSLISLLPTSNAPHANMSATFIQASNNTTLFMGSNIASNSASLFQIPANSTFMQAQNGPVVQNGNSNGFLNSGGTEKALSLTNMPPTSSPALASNSVQNNVMLMQAVSQIPNGTILNQPNSFSTANSNNVILQASSEQIYQLNNNDTNINKVVVFSNRLVNGLQQNMAVYGTPFLSNYQTSSVGIKEISEDNQTTSTDKSPPEKVPSISLKPTWELF